MNGLLRESFSINGEIIIFEEAIANHGIIWKYKKNFEKIK